MTATARVSELAEQIRGVTYGADDASSKPLPGYLPVLRAGNITDEGLEFDDLVFVPAGRISAKQKIHRNDVVIAASSGSLDVVGKAARALADFEGGFGAFCKVLRPRPGVDPAYFAHYFQTPTYRRRVSGLAAGANINNLRNEHLDAMEIPVPPLPEQRRIAGILDKADALRAKRRATLAKIDALTETIFLDMFGDPATNPKGWSRLGLRSAFWFQEGPGVRTWQFKAEGIKLLNVGNIERDGSLNLSKTTRHLAEDEAFGKYRHFLVDAGDLVIASSGISFDDDGLLRTRGAFVSETHLPLCMNTSTIRFKSIDGVSDLCFLRAWLNSREFRSQITKAVTGSAQQNFGPSHLSSLVITLPPLELQHEFGRRIASADGLKVTHRASLAVLDALFASLQHRAFRGEL